MEIEDENKRIFKFEVIEMAILKIIMVLMNLAMLATATNYTVGGPNGGWDQATDLQAWASSNTFYALDNLIFEYTTIHDVTEVSSSDYDSCNPNNPLQPPHTGGSTVIPLTSAGTRYFICGTSGHCVGGMKMQIDVLALPPPPATTIPPPRPATPPSVPPPPPAGPATPPSVPPPPVAKVPSPPPPATSPSVPRPPAATSPTGPPSSHPSDPAPANPPKHSHAASPKASQSPPPSKAPVSDNGPSASAPSDKAAPPPSSAYKSSLLCVSNVVACLGFVFVITFMS